MYDPKLLRKICAELSAERDSEKVEELLSLLRAIVDDDQEELCLRLHYLAGRFPFLAEELRR